VTVHKKVDIHQNSVVAGGEEIREDEYSRSEGIPAVGEGGVGGEGEAECGR